MNNLNFFPKGFEDLYDTLLVLTPECKNNIVTNEISDDVTTNDEISSESDTDNLSINNDILKIKNKLKVYNIILNCQDNIVININNSIYNFDSFEDLQEFENLFSDCIKTKNIYKKKNKKNKIKYNESLVSFLNKYESLQFELKRILMFNILEKKIEEKQNDLLKDNFEEIIQQNILDYKYKLLEYYDILDKLIKSYEKNKYIEIDNYTLDKFIIENAFKEIDKSFFNLDNILKDFQRYILEVKNFKINMKIDFKDYENLIIKYKKIKFQNLFYQFNNIDIIFIDDLSLSNFFKFHIQKIEKNKIHSKIFNIYKSDIYKKQQNSEINFIKKYNTLISFYEDNSFLEKEKDNQILINKTKQRFDYFKKRDIIKKNNCLINIKYLSKEDFEDNFNIDKNIFNNKLKIEYIDYIFNLPDTFFNLNYNDYNKNEMLISDFNKIFKSYNITFKDHIDFLTKMSKKNMTLKNILIKLRKEKL